ncbi:hypothetical protein [Halobacteriovorax sp. HLS]|uniref:hypothetical protein n=1 Tax=Halobacteriovorax sp. HLS TaxID=2234000 RepID=UPI000FDA67E0|nr:hypothetical protein [Halobacteriovorax sp. HLS]
MKKNFIFLLFVMLFSSGCDQTGLGVGSAIKNLFSLPVDKISEGVSQYQYASIEKRDNAKSEIPAECWVKRKSVSEGLGDIQKIHDKIRGSVCSCVPWGTCSKDECPCSRLCPDNFDIFKRPEVKDISDYSAKENSLAFRNGGGGSQHEATQGYCWGHASVSSKFNRLGFFDKESKPPFSLDSTNEQEQDKAVEYYKDIIDKIVDNQTVDIPGFENLYELSSHERLQSYIADHVATSWSKRAMSTQGLDIALSSKPMKKNKTDKLIKDIVKKIDQNQQPQIVFTKKGSMFLTHAVLVSHYEKGGDGSTRLCLRDNNNDRVSITRRSETSKSKPFGGSCRDYIRVLDDGSLYYNRWGDLGGVTMAYNETPDSLKQFKSLKQRCADKKGCQD